ncbi:MAG: DNA gyrase subunit A [bacterium]
MPNIGKIEKREITQEMQESYLDYAMSVIISRALPDVRDGLKPVHRRILYAMHQMGLNSKAKFRKSATVVGETMGKYHPHGDLALYDSLARMAQDFSMRYQLIDGQGNFGSIDGDSPAAMRYTEARLKPIGEALLLDIEKETVDFGPNYDGSRQEPLVLPSRIPQLLLNGSMGIAVGMATNIPPHNLREIIEAVILLINKPKANIEDLMQFVQGPDFPTAGAIYDIQALAEAYTTGRGSIIVRGKANIEKNKIIISEIPYQVNKASLVEHIAKLVKDKKLQNIKDVRDESDREGMRIVLELKKDAFPQKILNKLYNYSDLQKSFHFNILALVDGLQPKILSLKDILEEFIKHRRKVVVRRTEFELKINQARLHILEGLQKALDHIDAVIKTIRQSADKQEAAKNLIKQFGLTKLQAEAILEIKLQTLAGLERQKIEDELKEKIKLVEYLKSLLADSKKIDKVIIEELEEIKDKFGDERRTKVYKGKVAEFSEEDLVPNEKTIIALTQDGYIKRVNPKIYKVQKRGGRGLVGMRTKAEDVVLNFLSCSTHDSLFFFTNSGKVLKLKAFEVPEGSRVARGRAIVNFLNLQNREEVSALIALPQAKYLVMATQNGIIKKTKFEAFENIRGSGLIAIKLKKHDELRWVKAVQDNDEIILITALGQAIRFKESDIRPMGRSAAGVIGVRLNKDDLVVTMDVISSKLQNPSFKLLTITENGYGKRTDLKLYKIQKRGGKGIRAMKVNSKNGKLVSALIIDDNIKDLIVISQKGQIIRMQTQGISQMGRSTQGVRIMRLNNDRVSKSATIS